MTVGPFGDGSHIGVREGKEQEYGRQDGASTHCKCGWWFWGDVTTSFFMSQSDGFGDEMYLRVYKGRVMDQLCVRVRSLLVVSVIGCSRRNEAREGRACYIFLSGTNSGSASKR